MVFYNLFTLLSLPAEVLRIQTLVIQLLLDEQLEVTNTQQQQPKISKSLCDGHLMPPLPGVNPYPSLFAIASDSALLPNVFPPLLQ